MDKTQIITTLSAIAGTIVASIIGVIVGWLLNRRSHKKDEQPKLCFKMASVIEDDDLEPPNLKTKTSPSEFEIEIYNTGKNPVILEMFNISYKGKRIVDCFMDYNNQTIFPYQSVRYRLSMQDEQAITRCCKDYHFEQCEIAAETISGEKIKSTLSTPIIAIRASMSPTVE